MSQLGQPLTYREQWVLWLAGEGMTYEKVGRALGVSDSTVQRIVESARQKLGARNSTQAIRMSNAAPPPVSDGAQAVAGAWLDPGVRPDVHETRRKKLIREWPELAAAVMVCADEVLERGSGGELPAAGDGLEGVPAR